MVKQVLTLWVLRVYLAFSYFFSYNLPFVAFEVGLESQSSPFHNLKSCNIMELGHSTIHNITSPCLLQSWVVIWIFEQKIEVDQRWMSTFQDTVFKVTKNGWWEMEGTKHRLTRRLMTFWLEMKDMPCFIMMNGPHDPLRMEKDEIVCRQNFLVSGSQGDIERVKRKLESYMRVFDHR